MIFQGARRGGEFSILLLYLDGEAGGARSGRLRSLTSHILALRALPWLEAGSRLLQCSGDLDQ